MLDFRTEEDKKYNSNCRIIHCNSCGNRSMVSVYHGKYCPVCGPDTVTPVTVEPVLREGGGQDAADPDALVHIEATFEVTVRRTVSCYVSKPDYGKLYDGDSSLLNRRMQEALQEAALNMLSPTCDIETDYTLYNLDEDRLVVDWK